MKTEAYHCETPHVGHADVFAQQNLDMVRLKLSTSLPHPSLFPPWPSVVQSKARAVLRVLSP